MAREITENLDWQYANLIGSLRKLLASLPADRLYPVSENILRSAAVIEQTCGGLTANLWDDPFEWTLPETLSNAALIDQYLSEVDLMRQRAFTAILDDSALTKYIAVPSGEPCHLVNLLVETLIKAGDYRGRALATIKILSSEGAQGFII